MVWAPRLHGEPGGPTSITGTARFVPTTFYIASLPFQDALPNDGCPMAHRSPAFVWYGQTEPSPGLRRFVDFGAIAYASAATGRLYCSTTALLVSADTRSRVHGPVLTSPLLPNPAQAPVSLVPDGPAVSWIAPWYTDPR